MIKLINEGPKIGVDDAKKEISDATKNLQEANLKIKKATADLNKQGLSEAFADAVKKFTKERFLFGAGFLAAVIGLVCIGLKNASAFETVGHDWRALSGFAIAAPFSIRGRAISPRRRSPTAWPAA